MIFELVQDFGAILDAMPLEHPRRRILSLLDEAIRRDVHFIDRHSTTLFQCLWNSCWWYDCLDAAGHYEPPPNEATRHQPAPWEKPGRPLSTLMESWRRAKTKVVPGFLWLRSLRPPALHLGTAQKAVFPCNAPVSSVGYSPDGRRIVSGSQDCMVQIWDADNGAELGCLSGHEHFVESVAFSPDGRQIVSGSADCTVRVWDADSGAELRCLRHENEVYSVAYSANGQRIISGSKDGTVRIWDAAGGAELHCLRGGEWVIWRVAFSPDGCRPMKMSRQRIFAHTDDLFLRNQLANQSTAFRSFSFQGVSLVCNLSKALSDSISESQAGFANRSFAFNASPLARIWSMRCQNSSRIKDRCGQSWDTGMNLAVFAFSSLG